jgi:hypothetical protein
MGIFYGIIFAIIFSIIFLMDCFLLKAAALPWASHLRWGPLKDNVIGRAGHGCSAIDFTATRFSGSKQSLASQETASLRSQ